MLLLRRRIRKHNCKHIRLVLTQLDIANSPEEWKQVWTHAVSMTLQSLIIARRYSERCKLQTGAALCHQALILVSWRNRATPVLPVMLLRLQTHSVALWPCGCLWRKGSWISLCALQAVEKKLDEAQNDVLDQPLAKRAKAVRGKKPSASAKEAPPDYETSAAAQAAHFL